MTLLFFTCMCADVISAPEIVRVIPLNNYATRVSLREPTSGDECITGYTVEANGMTYNGSSTELVLDGLNVCDAAHEDITVRAHGKMLQGEVAVFPTQSMGGRGKHVCQ